MHVKVFFRYTYELSVRRRLSALADKTLLNLHDFIILHIMGSTITGNPVVFIVVLKLGRKQTLRIPTGRRQSLCY